MARYALNLPVQLKQEAVSLAKQQGVSLNQFILWAVSDKVGTLRYQLSEDSRFPQIAYRRGASDVPTPILRGTGIRVQTIVIAVNDWEMPVGEVAEEYQRPLTQIKEAMAFYDAHSDEINSLIKRDAQIAAEAGYGA